MDGPLVVIDGARSRNPVDPVELWRYRDLLYLLTWRDVSVRYRQTVLGCLWAILQPFLSMIVFTVFLGRVAGLSSDGIPYPVFSYLGLLPWMYFSGAVTRSGASFVSNSQLLTRVYFPRVLLPLSATLSALVDFGVAFLMLGGLMAWYGLAPSLTILLILPLLLITACAAAGVGISLAALNARYRDVQHAIPFLMQLWMFATPVVYPATLVPERWRPLLALNPLTGLIEAYRSAALGPPPLIRVQALSKRYRVAGGPQPVGHLREAMTRMMTAPFRRLAGEARPAPREFWALRDVSFEVERGEVLGIIGRNGAGKSTLLRILSRVTEPTAGRVELRGRVGSLLEVGTGFHPELTGRENVYLNGTILGMRRREIDRKFDEIVAFAGVEPFIDTAVKRYSSGMYVRLAFAVAAHIDTEIMLVDEVLAVGDAEFQKKCLGKMDDVAQSGRTVLFVSHNMAAVQRLCGRGLLLDRGRAVAAGPIGAVVRRYLQEEPGGEGARFEPRARRGTGWARVRDARLLDEDDRLAAARPCDGDLRFELDLEVADTGKAGGSLRGLVLELVICTEEGEPLLSVMNVDDPGVELPAGRACRVQVSIPSPTFVPGRYRLDVFLGIPYLQHVDEIAEALRFDILPPERPWRPYPLEPARGRMCKGATWACRVGPESVGPSPTASTR
jgi:lipopolysaccharide transport system ATP-binding protein